MGTYIQSRNPDLVPRLAGGVDPLKYDKLAGNRHGQIH